MLLVIILLASFFTISISFIIINEEGLGKFQSLNLTTSYTIDNDWVTNWTMDTPVGTMIEILDNYGGQVGVLHLNDSSTGAIATATHSFGESRSYGRVDVYIQVAAGGTPEITFGLSLVSSLQEAIGMSSAGNIMVSYGSAWNSLDIPTSYSQGQWYQIGFEFNLTSNTTKTYVDGVQKSYDPTELNATEYVDGFQIKTFTSGGTGAQGNYYIAWVDYSWVSESTGGDSPPIPGFEMIYMILGLCMILGIFALIDRQKEIKIINL